MAVYSRSTGIANSSQSSSNLPAVLPSMDLGSIIVKSLENTLKDVDTDDKDPVKTIREGIDTSVLGKKDNAKIPDFNKLYNQYMQLYKNEAALQKQRQDLEKKRVAQQKTANYDKQFDQALKSISTFAQNPLAGFDKGLQSIMKSAFGTVGKVMTKEFTIPKFWQKSDNAESKSLSPSSQVEKSFGNLEFENQLNTIIGILNKDKQEKVEEDEVEKSKEKKRNKEYEETKKEGVVREKARSKDAEKISTGITSTNLLVTSISSMLTKVGLTILGAAAIWPLLWGGINYLGVIVKDNLEHLIFSTIPTAIENFKAFIGTAFQVLVNNIKSAFMPIIQKIAIPLIKAVTPKDKENKAIADFLGISEEEYAKYSQNQDAADAYYKYQQAQNLRPELQDKLQATRASMNAWLDERGLTYEAANQLYGRGPADTQEQKEFRQYREKVLNLQDKVKKQDDIMSGVLGKTYDVDGEEISGWELINPGSQYRAKIKESSGIKGLIEGNVESYQERMKQENEQLWNNLDATKSQNKVTNEFDYFLKTAHASNLTEAINTGKWTTPLGYSAEATPEQIATMKKNLAEGKYRELSSMEKNAAIAPYFAGEWGNAVGSIGHAWLQSTKTEYQGTNTAEQRVGQTPVNVIQQNIDTVGTNMGGKRN